MLLSPKPTGSPGSCSDASFSGLVGPEHGRKIWFLKEKLAVVEGYEMQGEPSFKLFTENYNNLVASDRPIAYQQLQNWVKESVREEWRDFLDTATDRVASTAKQIPNYWKAKLNADDIISGTQEPRRLPMAGRARFDAKYQFMRQIVEIKPEWLCEIAPHYYKKTDVEDDAGKKLPKMAGRAGGKAVVVGLVEGAEHRAAAPG